jgi:type VII secretion protein EccB
MNVVGPAQLRAHSYARRRMDWALTFGTTLPAADPGRSARRCTAGSYGLAVALLAVAGVMSLVRPAPDWAAAEVLVESTTGAVYVNRDGTLHPALNLTSALLARPSAAPEAPLSISAADIADVPRGATLGIAGLPAAPPSRQHLFTVGWSLCDFRQATHTDIITTAVLGSPPPGAPAPAGAAIWVTGDDPPGSTSRAFLLWAGRRIPVDLSDRPLRQALGVDGTAPRPVSPALLAALPEASDVDVAVPIGAGQPAQVDLPAVDRGPIMIGAVLRAQQADGRASYHLVHRDGVEAITPVVADLVLSRAGGRLIRVEPWQVALLPETGEPTAGADGLPPSAPALLAGDAPLVCVAWQGMAAGWSVTTGSALATDVPVVAVTAGAPAIDQVQMAPGSGAVVSAHATDRIDGDAAATPTVLVTDLGVVHPLGGDAAFRLDLTDPGAQPSAAPAAVLDLLPRGPALDPEHAGRSWNHQAGSPDRGPNRAASPR